MKDHEGLSPQAIRDEMDRLTGQILRSIGRGESFEDREGLWMERGALRALMAERQAMEAAA